MLNVRFNIAGVLFFVAIATVIMLVWIAMFVACSHWLSKNTKNA
jgi:IS4 transposase